ncbi:unnamed protein product [Dovyalis caffra]|uniref:Peptidase A1 domain-containing protein n=1 Tax=Dovyalis caffra TaxID=77055 RepID=A0AAV1RR79_9ROSI|nr:unnamed protein product [Dovyalis caffra]
MAAIDLAILFVAFTGHFTMTMMSTTMVALAPTIPKPKRLVTKLIHRESIFSPRYNANDTVVDRAKRAIKTSIERLVQVSKLVSDSHDIQTNLLPSQPSELFYINFSIGHPPIPQLAIMDTGSSFLWVKCLPCSPCSSKLPISIFDPSRSFTYTSMSCRRYSCGYSKCNSYNECTYNITYVRGPGSTGIYVFEQLTFETIDDTEIVVPRVLLGCGRRFEVDSGQYNGVFGLGAGRDTSVITQLGSRFSYCVGNIMDPHYPYNQLSFGDGAIMEGDSTPLESRYGRYYVTLEGISFDGKMLDIDRGIFERTAVVDDGVILDSGTAYTWLAQDAYNAVSEEVRSLLKGMLRRYKGMPNQLCYVGSVSEDLSGFPAVTFHFANGAELVLDTQSTFLHVAPRVFCMAIGSSIVNGGNSKNLSVIGIMAQQNYNVGYDIGQNKLYFQRIDCELMED